MKGLLSCSGFVPGGHFRTLYFGLPTEKNNHVFDWLFYRETQNPRCWADEWPGDKWVLFSPFTCENRQIRLENHNGWCHSVWEVSDGAVRSEARQFPPPFSLFQLILIYFVKTLSPTLSKFIVLCLRTRFPAG